jgi:phage protein D
MIPVYRIIADGADVTDRFKGRLVSLAVTDQTGQQNDSCTLAIANGDGALILPSPGAKISVEAGYSGFPLRKLGDFTLDEVREASPPRVVTLTAKAADYASGGGAGNPAALQTQKTRSWDAGLTVLDIVKTIAAEARLTPYVTPTAATLVMPFLAQTQESDLSFLTRIANANNSWVKPAFGKLIFAHARDVQKKRADKVGTSAPVLLPVEQVSSWEFSRKARAHVDAVIAVWRDKAAAADKEVRIGAGARTGDTVRRIEGFSDERTARAAAEAKWLELRREGTTFNCTLPAPVELPFYAEGFVVPQGFGADIDGGNGWKLTSVEWNLSDAGFSVSLQCDTAQPEADAHGETAE